MSGADPGGGGTGASGPAGTAAGARVAVVIPVRDRETVVLRAVRSVLAQSFADFEVVVVDDGSSDRTCAAVEAVADPRVRLVRQHARLGANAARNRGVRESSAPLLAFLDSDDEFLPEKLAVLTAVFDAEPGIGAVLDSYAIVNPHRNGGLPEPLVNPRIADSGTFLAALFDSNVKSRRLRKSASGMAMRREAALAAGLFDETVGRRQDMEFLARLAKRTRCVTLDRVLWTKHERSDSITFRGGGFMEATLAMARAHPEYAAARTRLPADVVIYLWETARREGAGRVAEDLRLLVRGVGLSSGARILAAGLRARLVDARRTPSQPRTVDGS